MLVVAALALSSVATAQFRLDEAGLKKKIASADADAQDAKKGTRAATWVARGNAYYNAAVAPTQSLFKGMGVLEINLLIGQPFEKRTEEVGSASYEVWAYPHFDLYLSDGVVAFWKQKTEVVPDAMQMAFESYSKAAEIDPKQAAKMKGEVEKLMDMLRQFGDNDFSSGQYETAIEDFANVYEFSVSPLVNQPDTLSVFNAGYVATLAEKYDEALKYLDLAEKQGYEGEDGELYYYRYLSYYFGKEDMAAAEAALRTGIQKYPANTRLIEALILLYTTTDQDASQMIPMVEEALQRDPDNHTLHFALGLINDRLGNFDQAIRQFRKASELNPQDYASIFNLGLTHIRQADAMVPEINAIPYNQTALIEEKTAEFNSLYRASIPYFEQAYALNPTERSVVDILRSIFFRLRDEGPEMMQNYEKYDEILKSL